MNMVHLIFHPQHKTFILTMADSSGSDQAIPKIEVLSGGLVAHACRFHPGSDFVECLREAAKQTESTSLCIVSCVGSLSQLKIRMANATASNKESCMRTWNENLEIVSLTGTLSVVESCKFHLHISVADALGCVYGGHLVSGTVHTTAEIVLGSISGIAFSRELDPSTGFNELVVRR